MYGENGARLRAELSVLLRQHRVQSRVGGPGLYTVAVTTTVAERQQIGEQIRRYRQSALTWCHQATLAVAPMATSNLSRPPANPFRTATREHGSLAAMQIALGQALRASSAPLPRIAELTTPHDLPLLERWRQVAQAAALGEHDLDTSPGSVSGLGGVGGGRLDARQAQTVIGDVAAVVRALVVLDQRYGRLPGWERLARADRLGWSALACALDASLDPPDYSVDLKGWRPPSKVIKGPARPGLLGVLQAEHNLLIRMRPFPSAMNLRLVVDSQRLLSGGLAQLTGTTEPALQARWLAREQTYRALQHQLRNVGGRVGVGGLAVAEGANAVSRLKRISSRSAGPASSADPSGLPGLSGGGLELDPRVLHGFDQLFTRLDARIADIVEDGIRRNAYFIRVTVPRIRDKSGQIIAPPRERYIPLAEAAHHPIIKLARDRLRPAPDPPTAPPGAARSRAELHAAIARRPSHLARPEHRPGARGPDAQGPAPDAPSL